VRGLHVALEGEVRRLHVLHAERLQCTRGCSGCCTDELSVFAVEADHIRAHHGAMLSSDHPHAAGACAFLDDAGACRIYRERPYVCRTQGLPLRWLAEEEGGGPGEHPRLELRDICPLNEAGPALEQIPAEDCWTLGPAEEQLSRLQVASSGQHPRTLLRALFRNQG
jgi:uncharacterized protein